MPIAAKGDVRERFCKIKAIVPDLEPHEAHEAPSEMIAEPDNTVDLPWNTSDSTPEADDTSADIDNTAESTSKYNRDGYPNSEAKASYGPSYVYLDKDNKFYSRATRKVDANGKKDFLQSRWEDGQWKWGTKGLPKIPYRLPELIKAPMDAPGFARAKKTQRASRRSGSSRPPIPEAASRALGRPI